MGLKTALQQDRENIRELQEDRDSVTHGLGRTEPELDSGNPFQTLKLKMSEGLRENYTTSDRMDCGDPAQRTSPRTWKQCATERTYRIGDHRQRNDQPRRLIVTIHRWSDKMDIFTHTATPSDLHNSQMERQDGGFKRHGQGL